MEECRWSLWRDVGCSLWRSVSEYNTVLNLNVCYAGNICLWYLPYTCTSYWNISKHFPINDLTGQDSGPMKLFGYYHKSLAFIWQCTQLMLNEAFTCV